MRPKLVAALAAITLGIVLIGHVAAAPRLWTWERLTPSQQMTAVAACPNGSLWGLTANQNGADYKVAIFVSAGVEGPVDHWYEIGGAGRQITCDAQGRAIVVNSHGAVWRAN